METGASSEDRLTSVWKRFRSLLESERARVLLEIREYPTPIPRCDAQFNHLLEQRDGIARELQRIETLASRATDAAERVEAIIDESSCLSETGKRELRSILRSA